MKRKGYVVYKAPTQNNTRTITAEEWLRIGVEDQETLFWGPANNWKVPAADVNDAAWPHIEGDSGFSHEKEEPDDNKGDEVPESQVREPDQPVVKRGRR